MHYILKLPGTIAQVVSYPTTWGPFNSANEASLVAARSNDNTSPNPFTQLLGVPVAEQKAA